MEGNTLRVKQENHKEANWTFRIRVGVVILAFLWLVVVGAAWSRAAENDVMQSDSDSEYSFRWLDPEKKIYVLQNRRYVKANRLMLSFLAGPGFSNPYRNTFSVEPRAAYYLSESLGFEVFYDQTFNSQNNTYKALVSTGTQVYPVIRETRSQVGALAQWVPWYAKINFFNNILYFDWYLSGGLGSVNTAVTTSATDPTSFTNQNQLGLFLGTGQMFYIGDTMTVRLDFMGTFYRAPLQGLTGDNVWFSNYNFAIGFGVRL